MSEFKLSVVQGVNNLIDDYFGSNTKADKFINSTLKIMVRQNTKSAFFENRTIDHALVVRPLDTGDDF